MKILVLAFIIFLLIYVHMIMEPNLPKFRNFRNFGKREQVNLNTSNFIDDQINNQISKVNCVSPSDAYISVDSTSSEKNDWTSSPYTSYTQPINLTNTDYYTQQYDILKHNGF